MYEIREIARMYEAPRTGDFVAFEPQSYWLVVFWDRVGQPDVIASCWTESNAQMIADALNTA